MEKLKAGRVGGGGWDQVLNPLIQKQRQERKRSTQADQLSSYYSQQAAAAAAQQHHQQTAPVGGSYVYTGASGAGTVECDCGDDSCPNCNLLLQMSMGDSSQQW